MKINRSVLVLPVLVMVILIGMFSTSFVSGEDFDQSDDDIEEIHVRDLRTTTNETEDKNLWETIQDGIASVVNSVFNLIKAPADAFATVFGNWADAISGPLGLIIAGGVLFALYLLFRFSGLIDMILDRFN
jgi:hypothetical protein